jgi:hypothetical protein
MLEETPSKSGDNIVSEFKQKFGSHPAKLERFQITQKTKIQETENYLIQELQGKISLDRAELVALIYEFLVSEDLIHEPVLVFLEDFKIICENFGFGFETSTKEELIEKVVTPYLQVLKFQTEIYFELSRWLIQRLGQGWDMELARSYAINDFLKPLMRTIIESYPSVNLKFLAAMAWTTLERYTNKGTENHIKIADKLEILENYPDVQGSKFAYDLAYMYLLKPNWDHLLNMISKEIERLKETIKIEREIMLKEQQATKIAQEATAKADPVDDAKNQVSMKLNELFSFGYAWNDNRESQIFRALSLLLRRMSLREFGHVAAEDITPLRKELEEFIWPEMIEYPSIIAYGLNIKSKFYDPHYKESDEILEQFHKEGKTYYDMEFKEKFFQKLFEGYRGGADYDTISKNFCRIIKIAKLNEVKY